MKLVKINHYRCGEWSGRTFLWAPDDITEEKLDEDIEKAYKDHINAIEEFKKITEKGSMWPKSSVFDFPGEMTMAEAQKIIEEEKAKGRKYDKKKTEAVRSFGHFMAKLGYVQLGSGYDEDFILETDVYWGHRHGDPINMSDSGAIDYAPYKSKKRVRAAGVIDLVNYDDDDDEYGF